MFLWSGEASNDMWRACIIVAFLLSAFLLPWFITVPIGIIAIGVFQTYGTALAGGVIMDILFSAPEPRLFGFSFIYTFLFLILVSIAWYLERTMLE